MVTTHNFGRIVRDHRENKRITLEKAAEECGMSVKGYELIELGDSDPKLSNVLNIAATFDMDLGELNVCVQSKV